LLGHRPAVALEERIYRVRASLEQIHAGLVAAATLWGGREQGRSAATWGGREHGRWQRWKGMEEGRWLAVGRVR
jgi:hypothetical protein